jgi:hypothetical protein
MRCLDDGRSCEYILRLIWEDESSRRGVKHGRGKGAEVSFVDPTPPSRVRGRAHWVSPRSQRKHFLNTDGEDISGNVKSASPSTEVYRRSSALRLHYAPTVFKLSVSDGMLFQYCEYNSITIGGRPAYNFIDQDQVCQALTLVDDASNSYRQIVLPLSVSHECVKRSIMAVGALHLSLNQSTSSVDYYSLALLQKQRTLHQLRHDITFFNGTSNNHILVSMLMLCLFDVGDLPHQILNIADCCSR